MFSNNLKVEKVKEITSDIFPEDHKYLTFLKKVFRHEFRKNGFRRISTDIIENGVFRTNPETGIMKAYLNNNIIEEIQPVYYYFMDHYFNNDKQVEFIGAEIIGENDPVLDAICIYVVYTVLNKIGLEGTFSIKINSNGVEKEMLKYKEELQNFYENKKHLLSTESLELLNKDPIKLLTSELEDEMILASQAPNIIKYLKKDSKTHYAKFKEYLELLGVPFNEDHRLSSGVEYATNNLWEFVSDTGIIIGKGFRHNGLAKELGNTKEISATGFYTDAMIVIDMLKSRNIKIRNKDEIDLFFVQLGDEAKTVVIPLSLKARDAGINTVVSLGTPSMKEQMLKANRSGAKYVVMVGIMEARNGVFQVRNTESGTQEEVKKEELIDYIIGKIGTNKLDFYCPAKDLITE
ncbi:MAG: His/Gly/Thr/Pro-type tRNA ligase C-terminal domain-containing protein [Candidatus Gracilibacteria bacterium]|nr:His/Gly/Thr/Pro-type tRNA ligase C-terminal domain-containing protein [Candidatus Gracilibacteria bacterium]